MNRDAGHFDPVLEKMKEKEYKFKKCNPFAWSPFTCSSCKEKYQTFNMTNLKKNLHKMAYRVWTFMAFKWNDQGDDHIHYIVYYNMPKLDT